MERFHIIEDGAAILRSRGNFRQSKIYSRGSDVYASWGGGYIKLLGGGGTSNPNVARLDVEGDNVVRKIGGQPKMTTATIAAIG